MERIFIRIIFLVFPLIFFGLVNSSFHSDLVKNNKEGKNELNNENVDNNKNLENENQLANDPNEDDLQHFKLQGSRAPPTINLSEKMGNYKEYLLKRKKELTEIKEILDGIHLVLGDSFAKLVYDIRGKMLNDKDYELHLNKFYKLFRERWGYIRIMAQTNSSIYSRLLSLNERLSKIIVDTRIIDYNARKQYDEVMKCMREVIDLVNHNKSKNNSIRDYVRFIINQASPVENLSEVRLKPRFSIQLTPMGQLSPLSVQKFEEEAEKFGAFTFREMLLIGVNVFTILGITIYFIIKKKK